MSYRLLVAVLVSVSAVGGVAQTGEIIRGLPCIKRLNQLFCPSAGSSYPASAINKYIDDNRALMRRMYGEIQQAGPRNTDREVRKIKGSRFRRDILEGTLEDLEFDSFEAAASAAN